MTSTIPPDGKWIRKNQQYLTSCIKQIKDLLNDRLSKKNDEHDQYDSFRSTNHVYDKIPWDSEITFPPPAIELLSKIFGLSSFERSVLILCAATELDSEVASLFASLNDDHSHVQYPTFSLALSIFPDAHWSALAPLSPLRKFRLVDLVGLPHVQVTRCRLQIQERILHYLIGLNYLDISLNSILEPVYIESHASKSHHAIASNILQMWRSLDGEYPLHAQIIGPDENSNRTVAGLVCNSLGINLMQIAGDLLPSRIDEVESLVQLCIRESIFMNAAIYVSSTSDFAISFQNSLRIFLKGFTRPLFISTSIKWPEADISSVNTSSRFPLITINVQKPNRSEQCVFWKKIVQQYQTKNNLLGGVVDDHEITKLVNQFNLNYNSIYLAAAEAMVDTINNGIPISKSLWSACRKVASPSLVELAQQIIPKATMDDLIITDRERHLLKSIVINIRQRYKVYEEYGFGKISDRGIGINALFLGDSGTGKTMAAEAIANELNLDLFKIDLSIVVSKYIGETEKNLKKIFDSAEDSGAILFFDEADALFGKRSEVKDSHDRYANIEIGYLLQRMESYKGLAILTTNLKNSIDNAFIRRIRFIVKFPFPNEKSRKEIWMRIFPPSMPINDLDFDSLSKLEITGGNIHNIALSAAFYAANDGVPVSMEHLFIAAKDEFEKMDRPVPGGKFE